MVLESYGGILILHMEGGLPTLLFYVLAIAATSMACWFTNRPKKSYSGS